MHLQRISKFIRSDPSGLLRWGSSGLEKKLGRPRLQPGRP
jgi:hypothetical protein